MTKEEIIKTIWNELPNLTVQEARKLYETSINLIRDTLARGEHVELRGFGSFQVREKNERMGRNPRTGQQAVIEKRRVVVFKPSKDLKERVNQ
jgi:integration host factor subunit beta